MDGPPVDPESAWSGYAGAAVEVVPPGVVKRPRQHMRVKSKDGNGAQST